MNINDQVFDQVWHQVLISFLHQTPNKVADQVRAEVINQVRRPVGDLVWGQVRANVEIKSGIHNEHK